MKNKYKEEYNELLKGEKEINDKINKSNNFRNGYTKYGVLSKKWVEEYKKFLFNSLYDNNNKNTFEYNVDSLRPPPEEKIFCLITDNFTYYLPYNFILVTEKFINLLSKHFTKKDQEKIFDRLYYILIGGCCVIRKD